MTNVTERFSQKTGKPFGFVTIEDFDSSGEIGIFGNDWARWNGMLKKDYSVFITAKCVPRFRDSNIYNINIQNVEQLYDVKSKRLEKLTITIDTKKLESTMVNDLTEVVNESPGSTQLYFRLRSEDGDVLLHSAKKSVNVDKKLINYLKANDAMEYKIN